MLDSPVHLTKAKGFQCAFEAFAVSYSALYLCHANGLLLASHLLMGFKDVSDGHLTFPGDALSILQAQEGNHSCLDNVMGVSGTEGLGKDIADADLLHDGADGTTCDDASAGRGGFEDNLSCSRFTDDSMWDRAADEGNSDEILSCFFFALPYSFDDLLRLSHANTDESVSVTDNDDGVEAEAATALDDFGHPVYLDDLFFSEVKFVGVYSGHMVFLLEL